jgi:hypothetical protein
MRTMAAASAVIASLTLVACARHGDSENSPEATPEVATRCPAPAQGSRFALCGALASSQPGGVTANGRRLLGSLESTPAVSGEQFTVKGATLNAIR